MAYSKRIERIRRIVAFTAIIIMLLCALLTLVFAILYYNTNSNFFSSAWKASAWSMFVVPLVCYGMLLIHNVVTKDEKEGKK